MTTSLFENYKRAPVTFVAGNGCELIAENGERYLDFIGGIAVCALGHANAAIADAVAEQARRLLHVSNLFSCDVPEQLARELCARSGFDRAFFCNSGTEANEAAIKLARKYAFRSGSSRSTIVSCTGGFHGRTLGALAATPNPHYHEGFAPLPGGFRATAFNDSEALDAALSDDVAAFIVEPVQGESGVFVASDAFLRRARELCTQRGILLVFDEIQCGMGRIGPTFAFRHFGVRPDVVTMAKALANGLPIGAVLAGEAVAAAFEPGDHGTTFGGSPVPCAAAITHLRERDRLGIESHVMRMSGVFADALRSLHERFPQMYGAPRGIGMLWGLPVIDPLPAAEIVENLRATHRILANAAGNNTIRFAPPLIAGSAQIERVAEALAAMNLALI